MLETATNTATSTGTSARRAMIDSQLRTSGVNAPFVLSRMNAVAREDFVPPAMRATAYMDRAIRLADNGALPAPLVQGMILQEAAPKGDEVAVVVSHCGYLAELLRPLVAEVIELSPEEATMSGAKGNKADLLLVDGAAEELPKNLLARLAEDARIVTGTVDGSVTRLAIGRKTDGKAALFPVQDIGMPRMAQFDAPKGWSF